MQEQPKPPSRWGLAGIGIAVGVVAAFFGFINGRGVFVWGGIVIAVGAYTYGKAGKY